MIGASKILTVSYGTFSCTLEGFDDPFNTMKAIAEYFRDLAAGDRYFGAEPPQPDAAMLHKIAEREVHRRVEAQVQDNGVILRASDVDEPETPAVAAEVPVAMPQLVAEPPRAVVADAPGGAAPGLNAMPDGVAARLAKIRAAVALAEPKVALPVAVALSDFTEDQHADEAFAPVDDTDAFAPDQPIAVAAPELDDSDDLIADLASLDGVADADAVARDAHDDTMLANLAAMDAPVVADAVTDGADIAAMDVSLLADIMSDGDNELDAVEDALRDVLTGDDDEAWSQADELPAELLIADEPFDGIAADADAVLDVAHMDADLRAVAAADADDDLPEMGAADADDDMPETVAMDADDDMPETVAADADDDLPETVAADADDDLPEMVEMAAAVTVGAEPTMADVTPAVAVDSPALLEKAQRARARVIRVRRNPDIAVDRAEAVLVAPVAAVLPDDAEAELQRELAALEADTTSADSRTQDADDALRRQLSGMMVEMDANADLQRQVSTMMTVPEATRDAGVQEDSVRRLLEQTQSEMAVPENRRRLSSIAHLKAAVAATIAERFGAKPKPVEEVEATRTEPYRNDLARTVRPVRPAGAPGTSERPAPLVLVSEQRIDRPAAPLAVSPVRPRRVTAQTAAALQPAYDDAFDMESEADEDVDTDPDNIFGDARGFAEFADRVGANGLPDLLEAAAAYGAAVEGRDSFTRPQLLRQFASVTGDDVTREDELRSFGALLRDGRIVKVKRGQFALTETSALLAEARKIAG